MKRGFLILSIFIFLFSYACAESQPAAAGQGGPPAGQTESTDIDQSTFTLPDSGNVISPEQFAYLGAFRLPGGWDLPETFAYGGNAMTFNPAGDPGDSDGFPGSLFITGHDRIAYGGLPDGNQVAEVSIPVPEITKNVEEMNTAEFIQPFADVTRGFFTDLEEIPKVGLHYLDHPATGPKVHIAWGQHLQPQEFPSHGWFDPDLNPASMAGTWFIGSHNLYSVNGYMFGIPTEWADQYTAGKMIATGRMRDGGQGGMGPTLFAYKPWVSDGSPSPDGARLEETTLLLYENAYSTLEIERAMDGYQHPDQWEGGAWLTDRQGNSAVMFAGTKGTGEKYWYGFAHPYGPDKVCVDAHETEFPTCRLADGSVCPASDMGGCCDQDAGTCVTDRGWWSSRFDAELILYDPADLAAVAAGKMESWEPQPYAVMDVDEHLLLTPPEWDRVVLGWGNQLQSRLGAAAFDRENAILYVLELFSDEAKPLVHVWQIN